MKFIPRSLLSAGLLIISSIDNSYADSKTVSFNNRKVVSQTVNGRRLAGCPVGECTCNVTITLRDDGTFKNNVWESYIDTPPPNDPPDHEIDMTNFAFPGEDLNSVMIRVSDAILNGNGLPILE